MDHPVARQHDDGALAHRVGSRLNTRQLRPGLFRGPSLFDILANEASGEPVLSSLDGMSSQPVGFPVHDGPLYGVVHKGYRYIVNVEGAEELYRLDDEDERTNLAASPDEQGIMTEMRATLAKMQGLKGGGAP